MAAYRLYDWSVRHHPGNVENPAYADVTLDGIRSRGFLRRHAVSYSVTVRILLLPVDTADAKGSRAIVTRAMAQSADKWKGKP